MSLVIVHLCSLLLLLCERKLMTFSKDNTRYEYDVFSKSRQVLILSFWLNIPAAAHVHTYHFVLCVLIYPTYE